MSADKMPPLPSAVRHDFVGDDTEDLFTAEQMHAYARAYAAEQVRELVEALLEARVGLGMMLSYHGQGTQDYADAAQVRAQEAYDVVDGAIAKHKGAA